MTFFDKKSVFDINQRILYNRKLLYDLTKKSKDKVNTMSLMQQWEDMVSVFNNNAQAQQKFWTDYYLQEKGVYEKLLEEPVEAISGTVQELADKFEMDVVLFGGFLDGINESLKEPNPVDTIEADSQVTIDIDLEKLYYNMVAAKAEWLYELPQWDKLLDEEKRKELYKAQKRSMIVVKGKKIGRNEPCPCGSGKKYKFCCGR